MYYDHPVVLIRQLSLGEMNNLLKTTQLRSGQAGLQAPTVWLQAGPLSLYVVYSVSFNNNNNLLAR